MDIDDVPIKANMTHSEWKSIDSICMISMILPSLSKTMALWRWLGREKCFILVSHSKVQEGWGWSQGTWGQGKDKHSAPFMSPQSSWPEEGTGDRTLCSAGPREIQVFSVEEACTYGNSWVKGKRGPLLHYGQGFPGGSDGKASAYNAGDPGSIPWSGRSLGERNGNPFQYSCLENSMNGGVWQATYSPWGRKESDTTERLHFLSFFHYSQRVWIRRTEA